MPDEVIPFSGELEALIINEFGEEATPEFLNMLRLGKAAYEHGYHGFIPLERVVDYAIRMYEAGKHQRDVVGGKGNGDEMITINGGDVRAAASHLSIFGRREGYLSPEQAPV